jgi:putative dimethyl sulfoxide reductase chaperone
MNTANGLRTRALDAELVGALEVLSPDDQLRLGAFRLFSRLLAMAPEAEFFAALRRAGIVRELVALALRVRSEAAGSLESFDDWLGSADAEAFEDARRDYLEVFVSARHLPAPPWESVYRSPERLVLQEPAREVLKAYIAAGLGFEGMKQSPADHIALELAFAAALLVEAPASAEARSQLDLFEAKHMSSWMPSFCVDLGGSARTPPYRTIAAALPCLLGCAGAPGEHAVARGGVEEGT